MKKAKDRIKDKILEKKAILANIIALIACIIAIITSPSLIFTLLISVITFLQIIHIGFGDFTASYKLLNIKAFRLFHKTILIALSISSFILFLFTKLVFFIVILLVFWADYVSSFTRNKKQNNKIRGLINILDR